MASAILASQTAGHDPCLESLEVKFRLSGPPIGEVVSQRAPKMFNRNKLKLIKR
jgi:hypothetical protein